jgi:hypothetical protein
MHVFGFNYVIVAVLVIPFVILFSVFYARIGFLAKSLGKGIGLISFIALALLLLAGTTGGSFNLSDSNETIAFFLFAISLFGLTSFFWAVPSNEKI